MPTSLFFDINCRHRRLVFTKYSKQNTINKYEYNKTGHVEILQYIILINYFIIYIQVPI